MRKLLSTKDAAEELGVSLGTIYNYINAGILKAIKLGCTTNDTNSGKNKRHWRIKEKDFESLMGSGMPDIMPSDTYPPAFNKSLKASIRKRDGFRCQMCGIYEQEAKNNLHIHHIDYDKANNRKKNLVCLCNSCHIKTNANRIYWQDYFRIYNKSADLREFIDGDGAERTGDTAKDEKCSATSSERSSAPADQEAE